MSVLVVTFSNCDPVVEAVIGLLAAETRVHRLDADHFPMTVRLRACHEDARESLVLETAGERIDLTEVEAAWFHHTYVGYTIPRELGAEVRRTCLDLSQHTLQGLLASLGTFLVDPFGHAQFKQVQLRAARAAGLPIPATVIGNDAAAVRELSARCPGGVVAKAIDLTRFDDEETGTFEKVYTTLLGPEDLAALDESLPLCPMIFQERLEKSLELRVVAAGTRVLCAAVDPRQAAGAEVDWRREFSALKPHWRPYELPADVRDAILRLMARLELQFGVLDLVRTTDGRHVFLEVNSNGGGFELLHVAGLPVARAVADLLLRRTRRT